MISNSGPSKLARTFFGALSAAALSLALPRTSSAQQPVTHTDSVTMQAAQVRALSLGDAVSIAEGQSEVVRIAGNAVTRTRGQQFQARSGLFPQLNASANYTRTLASQFQNVFSGGGTDTATKVTGPPAPCSQYILGTDSSTLSRVTGLENYARCTAAGNGSSAGGIDFSKAGFGAANAYTWGLSGSQNLFTGGRLTGQIQSANALARSARIELTAQQAQLRLDVTSAYYDAALSDRLLAIAQATLKQTQDLLAQTQLQNRVGNVAEFDLLRAQVSVSNQVPVVLAQVNARDVAYLRLKQLLNVPYEQRLALTTSVEDSTAAPPGVDLAKAASPDTATDHRASVREAGETVASQKGLLKVAHAERIPTLAVSSAYSRVAYPSSGLPTGADFRPNWTVTLGTSFPIFAGGRIRGDEMVAQANLRDARSRLQQARELASLDARVALSTLDQAQATLAASSGTAAQAQRAFDIATLHAARCPPPY